MYIYKKINTFELSWVELKTDRTIFTLILTDTHINECDMNSLFAIAIYINLTSYLSMYPDSQNIFSVLNLGDMGSHLVWNSCTGI